MRFLIVAAATLAVVTASMAATGENFSAQTSSPVALAVSGETLLVLDEANGALLGGTQKTGLERVDLVGRPRGAGGDGKGQAVVVTGDATAGYRANLFAGLRKLRSFDLKPGSPLAGITDAAMANEIIWLLQQTPPLVVLFGADGAELARANLSGVANAPFSLALGPSGEGYVTDPLGPSVIELTAFGQYKATHKLSGTGFTRPTGVAVGIGGRLWISDTVTGEVAPFTIQNRQLAREPGLNPSQADDPLRLAISADTLWVLSGWTARITKIPVK